ncbi:MAG: DUF600 family protein [Clostridiales bacterium]|nr:DUF600 family protein [Clostridiales bacterium]
MRKKETDKALEIVSQIQELIYYIIPEKWKNIELYISMPDSRIRKGELFFYYLPNSIFKRQYINCYEVPYMFNISEKEYSDIMSKLYNKFMILKEELNKNNRQIEEIYVHITKEKYVYEIATDNVRLIKENIERNMLNLFSSYENHIIWRYLNLNILPDDKKEKNIITRYLNTVFPNLENEKISFDIIDENIKSIVDFEKILTVEEAIARSIYENKKKEKKKKEELFDDYNEENLEKNNKKSLFSNIFNKFNKNVDENNDYKLELEKEKFLDINKQDEDLENYILEDNSGLWDEGNVEWIDDIDSLEDSIKEKNEKKVKKDKTEEKGLFD